MIEQSQDGAERRNQTDRRSQPRGGRRITDIHAHEEAYVTVQQLADYLGFSRYAVLTWIEVGSLPAYRFGPKRGGDVRILRSDAVQFIETNKIKPAQTQEKEPRS